MKSICNIVFKILFIKVLLIISNTSLALMNDSKKPINIDSVNQALDLQGNIATFTNNVVVTQGSIKITADKVIVMRLGDVSKKITVEAFGNPTTFYQLQDNGKPIKGHAQKIHYNPTKDCIELINNAYIEQLDSNLKGNSITYLIKEQKVEAFSGNKNKQRITTVLLPSQLNEKSNLMNSRQNN